MIGTIDTVLGYDEEEDGIYYHLKVEPKGAATVREENLEPYTEPQEEKTCTDNAPTCTDKRPSQDFDNIIKDGFRNERRLNIAARIMAAMMQNAKWGDKYSHIAQMAFAAADALLTESQKEYKQI